MSDKLLGCLDTSPYITTTCYAMGFTRSWTVIESWEIFLLGRTPMLVEEMLVDADVINLKEAEPIH